MTDPTPTQLHHLANRVRDGVALPAEHDALTAGITAMAARIATLEAVCESNKRAYKGAVQAAWIAEAAIERVRAIHTRGTRTNACNDCGQPWPCELTRALDQAQQPTTTEAAPFGDRHGPTPDEVRAGLAGLFTAIGPPVACPHCGPDAAPVPATHWTKHLIRHHPEQPTT